MIFFFCKKNPKIKLSFFYITYNRFNLKFIISFSFIRTCHFWLLSLWGYKPDNFPIDFLVTLATFNFLSTELDSDSVQKSPTELCGNYEELAFKQVAFWKIALYAFFVLIYGYFPCSLF